MVLQGCCFRLHWFCLCVHNKLESEYRKLLQWNTWNDYKPISWAWGWTETRRGCWIAFSKTSWMWPNPGSPLQNFSMLSAGGMEIAKYIGWTELISCQHVCHAREEVRATGNDGLNNKTEAFRQFSPPAVLFCRFSSCWSNIKYLNETGSCRDLSIEVFLSLLLLHLQGKAWA